MPFDAAGRAVDYPFLEVNPRFVEATGLHDAVGRRMRERAPAFPPSICARSSTCPPSSIASATAPSRAWASGLSLVRSLVQRHGGEVEARSEGPGRGAEFVVRRPLRSGTAC